jgi:predicted nucleic-acid-binding Zn-ribbon protein
MKISACPNCGGNDLYRNHDVHARGSYGPNLLPGLGGFFSFPKFTVVLCATCGLTRFFAKPETLKELPESRKWLRV